MNSTAHKSSPAASDDELPPLIESVLLAAISMILVWRLLIPTEGASQGHGLWIAQCSLAALVLWVLCCWRRGGWRLQFHRMDLAVALVFGGHLFAGFWALAGDADQRATINMLCEWAGLAATYFLLRQTFVTVELRRQITLIMIATAAALAGYGLWQHFVVYPQAGREYTEIRQELDQLLSKPQSGPNIAAAGRLKQKLMDFGVPQNALEGRGRDNYEARLLNSTEPLGRFALTNTFAGFLVVWLMTLAAITAQRFLKPAEDRPPMKIFLAVGILAVVITWCLLLTKSRTAYVGLLAGSLSLLLGIALRRSLSWKRAGKIFIAIAVVLTIIVTITAISGGVDRWVIAEAPKSLRYRLEYWQATWEVIRDHPLLGVGSGNFRSHYLEHKLPESSEEISDPHNLLLDVWANGGILALGGLIAAIALACVAVYRNAPHSGSEENEHSIKNAPASKEKGRIAVPIPEATTSGAMLAFAIVALGDDLWDFGGLFVGWLVAFFLTRLAIGRFVPAAVIFAPGLIALLTHLLGAGGIGMPAICQTFLILVALTLPTAPSTSLQIRPISPISLWLSLLATAAFSVTCWIYGAGPVTARNGAIAEGDFQLWGRNQYDRAEKSYREAAKLDPYSDEPWRKLAELRIGRWLANPEPDEAGLRESLEYVEKSLEKNPRSWTYYRILGEYNLRGHSRLQLSRLSEEAVRALTRAVELYPNHAELQGRLAVALAESGDASAAAEAAARALELNEITRDAGHVDRLLPEKTVELLEQIANHTAIRTESGVPD